MLPFDTFSSVKTSENTQGEREEKKPVRAELVEACER